MIPKTPAARQVELKAPRQMRLGGASKVTVRLTRSGSETLGAVRLSLQVPEG